jgi:hypothetical protein
MTQPKRKRPNDASHVAHSVLADVILFSEKSIKTPIKSANNTNL